VNPARAVMAIVVVERTQRYSATFATRSQSCWLGCGSRFIRQWRQLCADFSSHVQDVCGSVLVHILQKKRAHQIIRTLLPNVHCQSCEMNPKCLLYTGTRSSATAEGPRDALH